MTHAEPRYLEAKRTVDDRALSRQVRDRLVAELPPDPRILEAGCGTGAMVPRLTEWGISGSYRGIDKAEQLIAFAQSVRLAEFRYRDRAVAEKSTGFEVDGLSVSFESGDALRAFDEESQADLFIACGFADLVPIQEFLSVVESTLRSGGLAYVPITFDAGTIFQPDHPADEAVEQAYHQAIDEIPGRDSRAGRHLADALRSRPGDLIELAPSDWIVRPNSGSYSDDEQFFLGRILEFVETTIGESTETVPDLDDWLSTRRSQLGAGTLTYVAHQYDLLYRTE